MTLPAHHLWQKLMETDQASEEFPRLAIEILDAQRQTKFDVLHQFAEDDVPQLIDLIDKKVLQHKIIPTQLKGTAFRFLRRLCGTFQRLPSSCLIDGELMIDGGIPCSNRAYADLRKGSWRGENVAIKLLRTFKDDNKAEITKRFCKEIVLWKQLRHKNLLPFYGACMGNQLGMVSPWLENGSIIGFTRKNPEANRLNLLIDVSNGLEYLHHSGVIHGNLRSSNILISDAPSPHALLSDYGLTSVIFDPFFLTRESINWTAQELLTLENDRRGRDVYAFAMVIYEVLSGSPPFSGRQKPEAALHFVLEGERPPRPKNSESLGITNEIWNLLETCWTEKASSRPKVGQVVACLNRVAKNWTADASAFLLASSAGFQSLEVMGIEPEKVQKIADDIARALDRVGLSKNTRKSLRSLQKLCGASGVLPRSFFLAGELEEVSTKPFSRDGFAYVYEATYEGQKVVVKVLRTDTLTRTIAKEVVGWKWLRHDNILPFLGATLLWQPFCLVSPWMENGNIMKFLRNRLEENPFALLVGVAKGLQFLHDHDFVHGDLKGVNILIDSDHRPRLAEFGLARIIEDSEDSSGDTPWPGHKAEPLRWSAPECLHPEMFGFGDKSRKRLPSKSTDIYALGMTVLEVVTRRRPFDHITAVAIPTHVLGGNRPERPRGVFSGALWELLHQSWNREYKSTPSIRPPISLIQAQLEKEAETWDPSPEAITTDADSTVQSSSDTEPDFEEVLEEVRRILEGSSPTSTTDASPRGQESKKGKGAKSPNRNSFQTIRERFRLFPAGSS